jgi:sister-chromatid-cohesion protein PDS5
LKDNKQVLRLAPRMVSTSQSLLKVTLPLAPRANKPITTADLINRLTSLSEQLIDANQDNAAIKGQLEKTIAPQLIDKNLLQHKDKGVKSYVAVCIVEALRICAPDAPFNAPQLKVQICVYIVDPGNL